MFIAASNASLNTSRVIPWTVPAMHQSASRLYKAAELLRRTIGQSAVARLLNESPQTVKNWEARGVSAEGAIKAEEAIGCRAAWIRSGTGHMTFGAAPSAPSPSVAAEEARTPYGPPAERLAACLPSLLDALSSLPTLRWASVRAQLDALPGHPEMREDVLQELLVLLTPSPKQLSSG